MKSLDPTRRSLADALSPLLQACVPLVVGAGVGAGVMMADDRRTNAVILEDQTIEVKARNRIQGEVRG